MKYKLDADDVDDDDPEMRDLAARLDDLLRSNPGAIPIGYSMKQAGFRIENYAIKGVIGSGGFGIVYRAWDVDRERCVALKIPRPEVLAHADRLKRFRNEAKLSQTLDHPGIVPVIETNLDSATPYIASEFCDGPNLMQWLAENKKAVIQPKVAARLVSHIADAVGYAHRNGIVHRDLKPANIILVAEGDPTVDEPVHGAARILTMTTLDSLSPRITDFGLAQLQEQAIHDTTSSMLLGSPNYMSPEQAEGRPEEVGAGSDIFALGAVLYQLLTGFAPFEADTYPGVLRRLRETEPVPLQKQRSDVERDLETICLKCLEKSPRDRFESADSLSAELNRYCTGQPIKTTRPSLLKRMQRWTAKPSRVREAMMAVAAISALRIVFAFTGLLMVVFSETGWTPEDIWEAIRMHLFMTTPIEIGIIVAAWHNARRRLPQVLWWIVLGMMCTWAILCLSLALSPSMAPGWYQRNPGARVTTFSLLAILFAGQAACWWAGDWRRMHRLGN